MTDIYVDRVNVQHTLKFAYVSGQICNCLSLFLDFFCLHFVIDLGIDQRINNNTKTCYFPDTRHYVSLALIRCVIPMEKIQKFVCASKSHVSWINDLEIITSSISDELP